MLRSSAALLKAVAALPARAVRSPAVMGKVTAVQPLPAERNTGTVEMAESEGGKPGGPATATRSRR